MEKIQRKSPLPFFRTSAFDPLWTLGTNGFPAAILLFGDGFTLNTAPIGLHRVVGVYIATLFEVWQVVSYFIFRSVATLPVVADGSLIVPCGVFLGSTGQAAA